MTPTERWTMLLGGILAAGYAVAALFFLRFWKRSADRLFAYFSAAFFLLAVQRVILSTAGLAESAHVWIYFVRLVAFLLIIVGIVEKNRKGGQPS